MCSRARSSEVAEPNLNPDDSPAEPLHLTLPHHSPPAKSCKEVTGLRPGSCLHTHGVSSQLSALGSGAKGRFSHPPRAPSPARFTTSPQQPLSLMPSWLLAASVQVRNTAITRSEIGQVTTEVGMCRSDWGQGTDNADDCVKPPPHPLSCFAASLGDALMRGHPDICDDHNPTGSPSSSSSPPNCFSSPCSQEGRLSPLTLSPRRA